jgi:large conductance mechanosensitive channel
MQDMGKYLKGFLDFVQEQGVVGLAVGLAIGVAAGSTVNTIVSGFIDPIIGFIVGGGDLQTQVWNTGLSRGGEDLVFAWGAILSSIITLLATAFVIYFIIERSGLTKLDKRESTK